MRKKLVLALLLSLLPHSVALAHARSSDWIHFMDWPTEPLLGGTSDFGRSVAGHFVGNARSCVVTLRGLVPVLATEPHIRTSLSPLRTQAHDLDVYEGGGVLAGQDAVVTAGPFGLEFWLRLPHAPRMTATLLDAGVWTGARFVRCADLDGDADLDIVGIAGDQRTILTLYRQVDGSWIHGTPHTLTDDVQRFELAQWTPGLSVPRLVLAHATKLDVRALDGTSIASHPSPLPSMGQVVAVLERDLAEGDRIAWARPAPNGIDQQLVIVDAGGVEAPVSFGSDWVLEMEAHDIDGDEDFDLCVARTNALRAELWIHEDAVLGVPPSVSFDATRVVTHDLSLPPATLPHRAPPILHDFDSDGSPDLYLPVDEFSGVSLLLEVARLLPTWALSWDDIQLLPATGCSTGDTVELTVTAVYPDVENRMDAVNGFEMVLWVADSYGDEMSAEARSRCLRTLEELSYSSSTGVVQWTFLLEGAPTPLESWEALFFLELRPVHFSGSTVLEAGPQIVGAFSMTTEAFVDLEIHPSWGTEPQLFTIWTCASFQGGGRVGAYVRPRRFTPLHPPRTPETDVACQNG